jgi:hypothetical protein
MSPQEKRQGVLRDEDSNLGPFDTRTDQLSYPDKKIDGLTGEWMDGLMDG